MTRYHMIVSFAGLLLLAAFVGGCGDDDSTAVGDGSSVVEGTVDEFTAGDDVVVAIELALRLRGVVRGVTVYLEGSVNMETVTDEDGYFRFENVPAGLYELRFEYMGSAVTYRGSSGQAAVLSVVDGTRTVLSSVRCVGGHVNIGNITIGNIGDGTGDAGDDDTGDGTADDGTSGDSGDGGTGDDGTGDGGCGGASPVADVYVSQSGLHMPPFDTWAKAATNIQDAVDVATAGDLVLVCDGVYSTGGAVTPGYASMNRVVIAKAITVRSVNGAGATTILGSGGARGGPFAIRCVYVSNGGILDGFTAKNGATMVGGAWPYDDCGGCVYVEKGAEARNCVMTGGDAEEGGGFYCLWSGAARKCVIANNNAARGGGVRFSDAPTGLLENCVVKGNTAALEGGGVHVYHDGTVKNCLIYGNTCASKGGGVFVDWGTYGGTQGVFLKNCTITGNTAPTDGGVGYIIDGGDVRNCIIYGNTGGNWSSGTYNNCCLVPMPGAGAGNTDSDPAFVNAAGGNYRLQTGSPCVDSGLNEGWMSGAKDLDGSSRIRGGTVDMGAYEQ